MNISSDTVAILKNFSDINQNILVKPGNQLQTISTLKNILAQADVSEKFEQEGVKVSAVRARQALNDIKQLIVERRKEIQELKDKT